MLLLLLPSLLPLGFAGLGTACRKLTPSPAPPEQVAQSWHPASSSGPGRLLAGSVEGRWLVARQGFWTGLLLWLRPLPRGEGGWLLMGLEPELEGEGGGPPLDFGGVEA